MMMMMVMMMMMMMMKNCLMESLINRKPELTLLQMKIIRVQSISPDFMECSCSVLMTLASPRLLNSTFIAKDFLMQSQFSLLYSVSP